MCRSEIRDLGLPDPASKCVPFSDSPPKSNCVRVTMVFDLAQLPKVRELSFCVCEFLLKTVAACYRVFGCKTCVWPFESCPVSHNELSITL